MFNKFHNGCICNPRSFHVKTIIKNAKLKKILRSNVLETCKNETIMLDGDFSELFENITVCLWN